jgi:ketosteroid isomerase-like protein
MIETERTCTERTRAVIENYVTMLREGNAEQRYASFTPNATWTLYGDLPTSRIWTGPEEIFGGFVAQMTERFDVTRPVTQEVRTILADGDHAVAEWTTEATTKNGIAYVNNVVIVFRIEDDKIAEAREYFDTGYARRVLFGS